MSDAYYLWVDIETTRLPFENHSPIENEILEISFTLTDKNLNTIFSEDFTVKSKLENLSEYSKQIHSKNGLLKEVACSHTTSQDVEKAILEQLSVVDGNVILAGSTLYSDKETIRRFLPNVYNKLHYQILDVASIRIALNSIDATKTSRINKMLNSQLGKVSHRSRNDLIRTITEYSYYLKIFKGLI